MSANDPVYPELEVREIVRQFRELLRVRYEHLELPVLQTYWLEAMHLWSALDSKLLVIEEHDGSKIEWDGIA